MTFTNTSNLVVTLFSVVSAVAMTFTMVGATIA